MEQTKDCKTIILEMIEIIPKDKENLIKDLREDYEFYLLGQMPEQLQWRQTIGTLYRYIQKPSDDWEYQVVSLFTNKSVDEIKKNQDRMHNNNQVK